jgi:ATP-dependent helicase/nuclease subunit A
MPESYTPAIRLTTHQQRALDHGRHLAVTANAGSGKTRVLVERYLDIVLSGTASVRDIVALTYTEKAASELRKKIADTVAEALASAKDPGLVKRLEAVRNELASAMIGTIHAFAARLLREHPVEADVDAAFRVIEGLDQRALLDDVVREVFRSILSGSDSDPLRRDVADAVKAVGRSFVVRTVRLLTERRDEMLRLVGEGGPYARSDDEVLRSWREALEKEILRTIEAAAAEPALETIVPAGRGTLAEEARQRFSSLKAEESIEGRARRFAELFDLLLTKEFTPRADFIGRGKNAAQLTAEETALLARLGKLAKTLRPLLALFTDPEAEELHRRMLRHARTFLEVARQSADRYEQRKTEAGQLDFEDLLLKARDLLRKEDVHEQMKGRIAFVMVDEYQDTNQLQYDILLPLLDDLSRGNLFIVGDPKQSIYRFRKADVAVFERTRGDIRRAGGEESDVVLGESFRPLRDIAAFVNLLFGYLMDDTRKHPSQVRYEPLIRARENRSTGRVEMLLREHGEPEPDMAESDMVARRILQLVASGYGVFDRTETPHPVRYGDIAVLLRSRTNLQELEQALIRHRIPYVVSSGVGYFQTQDIFDFYSYMQFLLNPGDDVALAGILRSPFFAVSDADLFAAAADRGSRGLWEHLLAVAARPGAPATLRGAVEALQADRGVALRLPVPEIIARIVRRTLYHAKTSATARAGQAVANLAKLQHIARSFEIQGFTTLYDFVERLRGLMDEEEKEGQGTVESEGNAVQVLTVHAAKGLEFPVVILPFLNRKFRRDESPYIDERLGIGFSPEEEEGEKARAPIAEFLRMQITDKAEAEEQRIFYVACTRARDLLVLSVDAARAAPAGSWRAWLSAALGPQALAPGEVLEYQQTTGILSLRDRRFVPSQEAHTLRVAIVRAHELEAQPAIAPSGASSMPPPRILVDPVEDKAEGEIFSATKIRTFVECPSRYYLRYVLGFPGREGPYARAEEDELRDHETPAELRGRVVHAALQQLASELHPDAARLREEVVKAFDREAPFALAEHPAMVDEMVGHVERVVAAPVWQAMATGGDSRTEFTISTAFGSDFLTGTIDRLYRDPAGGVVVVDYKTDAVDKAGLEAKAELYWPQLEFYALLASRFFSSATVTVRLVFTLLPDQSVSRSLGAADLARIADDISAIIRKIHGGEFAPTSSPCSGCPLQPDGCGSLFV